MSVQLMNRPSASCATSHTGKLQQGLTLIEILIALLVLSVGLAGIAVLHINSMKFAHASYYRSIASSASLDFEERMWIAQRDAGATCVSAATVAALAGAVQTRWRSTAAGQIAIPGLTVTADHSTGSSGPNNWVQATLLLQWRDERFNLDERFDYTTRVICPDPSTPP